METVTPLEIAERLSRLQELDTRITGLRREIEGLEEKHHLSSLAGELKSARDELAARENELEDLEQRQHKLDGELDLLSAKIKAEEEKLFSGTIMNPKELSAIQAEILSLRKKRDEMETEDLEEMEGIDVLRERVDELRGAAEGVSASERDARGEYDRELADTEHEVRELEFERDRLKAKLVEETGGEGGEGEEILAEYERLLAGKGGLAVVHIEGGRNCGGCHIEFTRTQIDRFQHEEGYFRCEYCRRILVK